MANKLHLQYKNVEKRMEYQRQYQKEYMKKYRQKRIESGNPLPCNRKGYCKSVRLRALQKLNMFKCQYCGCDVIDILEINHRNGGGTHQAKTVYKSKMLKFYRDIIYERINLKEYDVLCRVCNAQHYVETLKGIKGHKVIWSPSNGVDIK